MRHPNRRREFLGGKVRSQRIDARRQHASRGHNLDAVRARTNISTYSLDHFFDAVSLDADPRGMPTGHAHDFSCGLNDWAEMLACLESVSNSHFEPVTSAKIAHAGDASHQSGLRILQNPPTDR